MRESSAVVSAAEKYASALPIVQLSDIVYYASIVYVALLSATRVVQSQRWQ